MIELPVSPPVLRDLVSHTPVDCVPNTTVAVGAPHSVRVCFCCFRWNRLSSKGRRENASEN